MYEKDRRIVITLDAGGTNFVFGAVQGDRFVVEPITLPSNSDRLDRCLETMVEGFRTVIGRLPEQPAAISFAFPGPADYPRGIIGGYLPNFPSFRDGVALKDFLEERFGIPTFINNDGDLYAYGEALAGCIARNQRPARSRRKRQTLPQPDRLHVGARDSAWGSSRTTGCTSATTRASKPSACGTRTCPTSTSRRVSRSAPSNGSMPSMRASTTIRSIRRPFSRSPRERPGDADAARRAFARFGEVAGDAMATAVTLIDGLIVIGGGITAARKYILSSLLAEMRGSLHTFRVKRFRAYR